MGGRKITRTVAPYRRWLKIFGVTILAFLLSLILFQPFVFSVTSLVSIPEKSDFNITDFYVIVADSRPIKTLDKNILIIDITQSDRDGIAEILDVLSFCDPLAVGLDVIFSESRGGTEDDYLLTAIENCPNLILAASLTQESESSFNISETSFFQDSLRIPFGAINLPAKYPRATIREFPVGFPSSGGTIPSFATAVARTAAPDAAEYLLKRGNFLETINYPSRNFEVIQPEELIDHAEDIHNRIILIGAVRDYYDIHATPTDSRMSGVMIHAYSIATILEADYIKKLNKFQNWLLAFLSCLAVIYLSLKLTSGLKGIIMRVAQLGVVFLVLVVGYHFFITYNILIDFSYTLLILSFGLFACDIWNGFETGIPKFKEGIPKMFGKLKAWKRFFSYERARFVRALDKIRKTIKKI